jgi:hypothetical protein
MALAPFPARNAVVDPSRLLSGIWWAWLTALRDAVLLAPSRAAAVALEAQAAALTTTSAHAVTTTGLYRVTTMLRVTTAATTSSSATVTLGWTDGGVACTQAFAAVTGNTTATTQSETLVLHADAATAITYAVAYASTAASEMQYRLSVLVEALP